MDSPPTAAPAITQELAETLARLQADLENVQRELDQALGVWRSALIAEKKEFQSLLQAKQLDWTEQETQWQNQRQTYEQKIQGLETAFKAELATREQHAVQALNELDDSWQRDKLLWDQSANRRVKELEERDASWKAENEKQAARILELQERIYQLESSTGAASTNGETLESEKAAVQDALSQRQAEFQERESNLNDEIQKQDRLIQKLQGDLVEMQRRLSEVENKEAVSGDYTTEWAETTVRSLEHQVTTLDAMIRFLVPPPTHPQRRKSDRADSESIA